MKGGWPRSNRITTKAGAPDLSHLEIGVFAPEQYLPLAGGAPTAQGGPFMRDASSAHGWGKHKRPHSHATANLHAAPPIAQKDAR